MYRINLSLSLVLFFLALLGSSVQANHTGTVRDLHQKIRDGYNVVFWVEDGQSLPDSVWTPIVVALWAYPDLGWSRAGVNFSYTQDKARADILVYVDPDGCARWGLPGSCAFGWPHSPCDIIFTPSALEVMPGGILVVNHEFGHCLGLNDHREREGYPDSIMSYHKPRIIEDVNDWRDVDLWPTDGDILRVKELIAAGW